MNNPTPAKGSGCQFPQNMVNQMPKYDNRVVESRKLKIIRQDLRTRKKQKFI